MSLNIEKVQSKNLIDELYQLFYPQAENKNIKLRTVVSKDALETFITDKIKLTQIIKNFLSNAIKFTDENGIVELKIEANNKKDKAKRPIKISVCDNGIGIEKDKINFIFEAFRQADGGTSRKYGGTGLGLSISKEFAGLLGGRISVVSEIGNGSEFALYIPSEIDTAQVDDILIENIDDENIITQSETKSSILEKNIKTTLDVQPKETKEAEPKYIKDDIQKGDTVILVVEDDKLFSDIIVEEVHKHGYKAIATYDGNSAISLVRQYKPTAILLDLMLPVLDGLEVLRVLKADIETRHIPIEILSFNDAKTISKKLGAISFIKKPISAEMIDSSITSLVNFAKNDKKNILIIENENKDNSLQKLLSDKNIEILSEISIDNGLQKAIEKDDIIDCIIISSTICDDDILRFIEDAKLKGITKPIIIYSKKDFTNKELFDLKKYTSSVVLKAVSSKTKLIEETSLFLHTVTHSLNKEKQELLYKALTNDDLLSHKTVLIVDDDIKNIYALSSILELKNIKIISAQNGQEAIELLKDEKNTFDIVLMDIMMPIMNGYEAIEEIRKIKKLKNLPIIAVTAKAQKEDRQKCIDSGANDYMAKPINQDKLLTLMKIWTKKEDL